MMYHMKKEILEMYVRMNTELFEALPSMMQDEEQAAAGTLEQAVAPPPPFNVTSVERSGAVYYDGMRVVLLQDLEYSTENCWVDCTITIRGGTAGTLAVADGSLQVLWDADPDKKRRDCPAFAF